MAPVRKHIGQSTTTSMIAYGISCGGATKCSRAAPPASLMKWYSANSEFSGFVEFSWSLVRESHGETSRKAGCEEIRMSGLMSGDGKRDGALASAPAPILDSTIPPS